MDDLIQKIREGFACFAHPGCVVVHPNGDCLDCPDVADVLGGANSESMINAEHIAFATIPLDCMTADAILHFLPAIAAQSLRPEGTTIAETVAWILGADEWDSDLTISQQIAPKLSALQRELILQYLVRLESQVLSTHAQGQLAAAKVYWKSNREHA